MKALAALIFPPLGVFLCGRVFLAAIFLALWIISAALCVVGVGFFLLPVLSIAGIYVVLNHDANKRNDKLIEAMDQANQPRR